MPLLGRARGPCPRRPSRPPSRQRSDAPDPSLRRVYPDRRTGLGTPPTISSMDVGGIGRRLYGDYVQRERLDELRAMLEGALANGYETMTLSAFADRVRGERWGPTHASCSCATTSTPTCRARDACGRSRPAWAWSAATSSATAPGTSASCTSSPRRDARSAITTRSWRRSSRSGAWRPPMRRGPCSARRALACERRSRRCGPIPGSPWTCSPPTVTSPIARSASPTRRCSATPPCGRRSACGSRLTTRDARLGAIGRRRTSARLAAPRSHGRHPPQRAGRRRAAASALLGQGPSGQRARGPSAARRGLRVSRAPRAAQEERQRPGGGCDLRRAAGSSSTPRSGRRLPQSHHDEQRRRPSARKRPTSA